MVTPAHPRARLAGVSRKDTTETDLNFSRRTKLDDLAGSFFHSSARQCPRRALSKRNGAALVTWVPPG